MHSVQKIGTGTGGLGNKRTSRDYPNYSIVKIDQNTEGSPRNLRRLLLLKSQWETNSYAGVKNSQMSKIIKILMMIKEIEVWRYEQILYVQSRICPGEWYA